MKNNSGNKLLIYIFISLLIHFSILIFFPLADRAGVASNDNRTRDFGFIQVVEYQPVTQTSQDKGQSEKADPTNYQSEKEDEKDELDKEKEKAEEKQKEIKKTNEEINEKINEKKKVDSSDDIEINDNKNKKMGNTTNNIKDDKTSITNKNSGEQSNTKVDSKDIITSEKSDTEMNIKKSNGDGKIEEKNEKKSSVEKAEKQEAEKPKKEAPPPPPTSGDLIAKSISPQYPKDLVGESKRGKVEFLVSIDTKGNIKKLDITNSSNIEQMDRTARLAIERGWEFKSYKLSYEVPITVNFNINNEGNPRIDVILGDVNFKEVSDE